MSILEETFPILLTEQLLLRPLNEGDLLAVMEISQYGRPTKNIAEALEMIQEIDLAQEKGEVVNWGMEHEGEIVGTCGYYRGFANQRGEIGFVMRTDYRRKGYMMEALTAIISFGYANLKLHEICAYTRDDNQAAIALLHKLQFDRTTLLDGEYRKYIHQRNAF